MHKRGSLSLFAAMFFLLSASDLAVGQGRTDRNRDRGEIDETDPLEEPLPPDIKLRVFIHRPKVIEHSHLGTCTTTASDSSDFGLTGWHLPSGGITWKLKDSTVPPNIGAATALSVLQTAFGTWNGADSGEQFAYGGTTNVKRARRDGTSAVLWAKLGRGSIAVTYVWFSKATNEAVEIDMVFNKRYPWAVFSDGGGECQSAPDAYDLQNIATHEIGHWVGLDDLYDAADVDLTMYGFGAGGELKKRTLASGDVAGALAIAP
jgi:hypothetical protein